MVDRVAGVFDEKLCDAIKNSKVLVVGAGGIGCEILKNLVLTGFPSIDIIDLDTIDVSNLNRQFLFHKEHVGKSKAEVAKTSALTFNPNVKITARRDSIISQDYGVNYFKQFSVVLSALDNRTARNHVNRMCLGADVPLVESGTAGYNGQVEVIKKGLTQCYECQPKAPQKTFPGCTIRNTPSEPIHCIVWAKHLFNQLFGEEDPDQDVSPDAADPENNAGDGVEEPKISEDGNVTRQSTRTWAAENNYDPALVFNKLFYEDINYLLRMDNLWKSRAPPSPLHWDKLPEEEKTEHTGLPDQRVWAIQECAQIFATSVKSLEADLKSKAEGDHLVWDKDDKAAMDFVAACANVRAYIFGIQRKSRFETKSMAGNIIPAIATANAIVAGLVVLRASAILRGSLEACTSVYLRRHANHQGHVCAAEKTLAPPNPKCYVCSPKPQVTLQCDVDKLTLKDLDEALRTGLNMQAPDAAIEGAGVVVLSSEEGETEHNNEKTLFELGLRDSSVLSVDDFFQNFEIRVILQNDSTLERTWKVITDGSIPTPEPEEAKPTSNGSSNGTSEPQPGSSHTHVDSDDDMMLIEEEDEVVEEVQSEKKKKIETTEESSESVAKRRRLDTEENCMIIE